MKEMSDFLAELAALQAEQREMTEMAKRAFVAGDANALNERIAQAIANREKVEALLARAQTVAGGFNRKYRRLQKALKQRAH